MEGNMLAEKRIRDRSVIQAIREEAEYRCEYVDPATGLRCEKEALGEPHHIVAEREGKTVEEIYNILGLLPPDEEPVVEAASPEPSLEELIAAYQQLDEQEQEVRWVKGQLLDAMLKAGAKTSWLSSQLGVSPAQIRELVKVYRTFPEEGMRIPSLSWYHHRVAANSPDPARYIALANDEGLSTRELRKRILEDEGKEDVNRQETNEEMWKERKLLEKVEGFLAWGGEVARWLKERLQQLVMNVFI